MKIRKLYICLTAALLIGGGIWHASLHRPTGPAEGVEIQGTEFLASSSNANPIDKIPQPIVPIEVRQNQQFPRFRIGTFNIHSCKGLDGRRDVDRVAKSLKGLDFAGLNEVQGSSLFEKQDQAALLGQRLGMAWLFAPAIRQWYWMEAGNGLLTRVPVIAWHRIPLIKRVDYSYRNAVQVDLRQESDLKSRVIHVLITHVNRRYDSEREAQLKEVISMFVGMAEPAVLLGDLNSTAQDAQIRQLMSSPGVIDAVGQVLGATDPERIDWIFARGLRCLDAGIVENDASDHPLIWAELE
ncbi:MAG: endonuclease/exonuclease/phosphatase family protein [Thermoguttaceae bacterium]